jgi:hypothetical protein
VAEDQLMRKLPARWQTVITAPRIALLVGALAGSLSANAQTTSNRVNGVVNPPPPKESADADRPRYRFNVHKPPQQNREARQNIEAKLANWLQRLKSLDRSETKAQSNFGMLESVAPPPRVNDRVRIEKNVRAWQLRLRQFDLESICGPRDDSQDVEFYDGKLGPAGAFVQQNQPATGQIQWNNNLSSLFSQPGEEPGDVSNIRWCSGTLVSEKLFLTASHCFDTDLNNWTTPRQKVDGEIRSLRGKDLAPLMHVNFNYQKDVTTGLERLPDVYPIVSMIDDHWQGGLDYAILELGPDNKGELPGKRYRFITPEISIEALQQAKMLTVIQHPNGRPKRVAAGVSLKLQDKGISYSDVDTLGGSSGAGLIDQSGRLIGVHTNGGCDRPNGANHGVTLNAIAAVSATLKQLR